MKKKAQKLKIPSAKKNDVHANDDVKRYIGAVAENFGSQVSAVAEMFLSLNDKMDVQNEKLDRQNEILGKHTEILGRHGEMLASHTEMIGSIREDVTIIKGGSEFLKSGMRIKVDYPEFETLEKRVRLMEAKMRR